MTWPWITLLLLGAVHGINPGMGWLFAAALGLQEGKGRAVWRALPALALGHALSIAAVLALAAAAGVVVPVQSLRWVVAAILFSFGVWKLVRQRHPRYGGMRVTWRQLAVWSFLMASAHGAGLMVVPLTLRDDDSVVATATSVQEHVLATPDDGTTAAGSSARGATRPLARATDGHAAHMAGLVTPVRNDHLSGAAATLVHTLGYLFVTALLAWIVFAKLGVRFLRSAWVNLDLVWALALIATAIATPLL